MKQCVTPYQFEIVETRQKNRSSYTLLRLEGRGFLNYAIAVEDGDGHELALLCANREACESFFATVVEGELASVHLREVAEDFFHDQCLEIF